MKEEHSHEFSRLSVDAGAWLETLRRFRKPRLSWPAVFVRRGEAPHPIGAGLDWRWVVLEWLLITVITLTFCAGFLDLGTQRALPGNEAEVFQALDWVLAQSIHRDGQFPLWNPYLQTGLPYVADPMLHAYNPLVTVPVLLFGVLDGFKIALFLSFLAAGLGMWWLGVVLGLGRASRLWMAGMYAFSGPAVARFTQGQYLFVLGTAWIPWALASLIAATRTRRRRYAAMAVLALALLFFSGNVYYPYYMLFAVALYGLVAVFGFRTSRPFISLNQRRVWIILVVGVLTLGLIAIQLLPLAEFWPRISKALNTALTDSHTLRQIFLDYVSKDKWRPDAIEFLQPEEFYAYVGLWPFLALLFLPLAIRKRERRSIAFLTLLFVFTLLWIDVRDMPWRELLVRMPFLNQFRYPTRMLIFGAFALIGLAGIALDAAWTSVRGDDERPQEAPPAEMIRWALSRVAVVVLAAFMIWSVWDVYSTNKQQVHTRDPYPISYEIMDWLSHHDSSPYYVANFNGWHGAVVSNGLRYIDAWYHFGDIRRFAGMVNRRPVQARPNYVVIGNDQTPGAPDASVVRRFETHTVYKLPHSLPFAFTVDDAQLATPGAGELRSEDVASVPAFVPGPNSVETIIEGDAGKMLVVLTSKYPGWRVTVDGRPQTLKNVGGYLAADVQPGIHKYTFSFSPTSFKVGLLITLLSLAVTVGLLVSDLRLSWDGWMERLRRLRASAGRWLDWRPGPLLPEPAEPQTAQSEATAPADATAEPPAPVPDWLPPAVARGWQRVSAAGPAWLTSVAFLEWSLFVLALLAYAVTRLRALDQFPIYFFTDEAIHPLLAEELIARHLRGPDGTWFPVYFEAAGLRWTPLLSVYFHALTVWLFGKSIFITRATSALISLLGAAAVGLILKLIFKARYWWTGVLILAIVPAWFLHSRTAFETVMMSSFFACFLLTYLLYRYRSPRFLFAAVLFAGATFYSYSNGQLVIGTAALLLFFSDTRYHLRNWRVVLQALLLVAIVALPLAKFRLDHPTSMQAHLRAVDSYWFRAMPLADKLTQFAKTYWQGISPQYWFFPNNVDLVRHRLDDYGHIRIELLPLVLLGLGMCLWRIRSSRHRTILLAALATPVGAALVGVGITRVLAFVIPASILAGLGLDAILSRLSRRVPYDLVAAGTFVILLFTSFGMLRQAVVDGPLWFQDYGLYGMQYGAKQLFRQKIPAYLQRDPNVHVMVSSTWANGTDRFPRFFLSPAQRTRVRMRNVDYYLYEKRNLNRNHLLVMTPAEYQQAKSSPKIASVQVEEIVPYPDGSPGFYFARMSYVDNVEELFAIDEAARRQLVEERVELAGQTVTVHHSRFDAGQMHDVLDGDRFTLARGQEANPLVFEFSFSEPATISGLSADFGSMDFSLTVQLYTGSDSGPITYTETYRGLPPDPHVEMDFEGGPYAVSKMRLEIKNLKAGDRAHIHVRELALR